MKILAIETSCDETAVALLECTGELDSPKFKILGNSLISQIELHKDYGGVYPTLAKREHQKNLAPLLQKTLIEAGESADWRTNKPQIDYIAVTSGPGLEPALWVGILFAEEIGKEWNIPVVPVNHMEGHIYSVLNDTHPNIEFPALALLVSGGHTELVKMDNYGVYEVVGKTRDDAVGEAFDKVARLLELPYPGGPKISLLAELHRQKGLVPSFKFPKPMIHSKNLDFSFSGLKTSVLYKLRETEITEKVREEFARAFEEAAVEVLIEKTRRAIDKFAPKTLIVAGGVSLNIHLQRELLKLSGEFPALIFRLPPPSLTGDNAVMIGMAGFMKIKTSTPEYKPHNQEKIVARGNLTF
ncbi:MAG: tRNA (adenosine(37)-N6)-threonylcarbamoyltransferase complex transferase subunit TsaD [Minisyncoccota bacterium]